MRRLLKDYRVWFGLLVLGYTLAGFLWVPWLAKSQLLSYFREARGLEAELAQVQFNPFLFRLRADGLAVRHPDGRPIMTLGAVDLDFDPIWLFRGIWRVQSLHLSAPELSVQRRASGSWNFAVLLPPSTGEPAPARAELPRLSLGELAINDGRIGYEDLTRTPAFRQELGPIKLQIAELSTLPDRRGDYRVDLGLGDTGRVHVAGAASLTPLEVDAQFEAQVPLSRVAA